MLIEGTGDMGILIETTGGNDVEMIDGYAFNNCSSLTSVTIRTVNYTGSSAQ